jgi:hypothetical protein
MAAFAFAAVLLAASQAVAGPSERSAPEHVYIQIDGLG